MIFPPPATPSFLSGCSCVLDRQGGWLAAPTLSLPASCSPYRAMHPGWGEKLLVSLPGPLQPSANQSSSSNSAHSQHCCFARSASGGKDTRARSNNMGHLQSDAQHSTVGTYSKAALLSHLENNPTLTLKVSNHGVKSWRYYESPFFFSGQHCRLQGNISFEDYESGQIRPYHCHMVDTIAAQYFTCQLQEHFLWL